MASRTPSRHLRDTFADAARGTAWVTGITLTVIAVGFGITVIMSMLFSSS
ncbi:MAG: hypothetical protein WD358_00665 [Nitriliruptoraceae bacterium]